MTAIFDCDDRGDQAMVHAGGRGLDPLQAALADHAVPVHAAPWHGRRKCRPAKSSAGDPLLAGVDDFGLGRGGGDLPEMLGLDRITEDNAGGGHRGARGGGLGAQVAIR